jgi:hypothetical protein
MGDDDEEAFLYGRPTPQQEQTIVATAIDASTATAIVGNKRLRDDDSEMASSPMVQDAPSRPTELAGPLVLFPVDALISVAPATDIALGQCGAYVDETTHLPPLNPPVTELASACGYDHTSGLALVSSCIRARSLQELVLDDACDGLWQLPFPAASESASGSFLLIAAASGGSSRLLAVDAETGALTDVPPGPSEGEDEGGIGFVLDGRTVAAGTLLAAGCWLPFESGVESTATFSAHDGSNCRFVQVHDSGVRVVMADATATATQVGVVVSLRI